MAPGARFEIRREGRWKLLVLPEEWSPALSAEILDRVAATEARKHPETVRLRSPRSPSANYYLKIYSPARGAALIKNLFRDSKAVRALKQSEALSRLGFHAPPALAAGEERAAGRLGRAFLLTLEIAAEPLVTILRERFAPPLDRPAVRRKRRWLKQLALDIRRLHQNGFVHGDLVASNIFVGPGRGDDPIFFYMDHDRTRRYPPWLPHRLRRRNLVQLNRFGLPGISLRDRMRFLRFYLGVGSWGKNEVRFARRLEEKTRKRYGPTRRQARPGSRGLTLSNGNF